MTKHKEKKNKNKKPLTSSSSSSSFSLHLSCLPSVNLTSPRPHPPPASIIHLLYIHPSIQPPLPHCTVRERECRVEEREGRRHGLMGQTRAAFWGGGATSLPPLCLPVSLLLFALCQRVVPYLSSSPLLHSLYNNITPHPPPHPGHRIIDATRHYTGY